MPGRAMRHRQKNATNRITTRTRSRNIAIGQMFWRRKKSKILMIPGNDRGTFFLFCGRMDGPFFSPLGSFRLEKRPRLARLGRIFLAQKGMTSPPLLPFGDGANGTNERLPAGPPKKRNAPHPLQTRHHWSLRSTAFRSPSPRTSHCGPNGNRRSSSNSLPSSPPPPPSTTTRTYPEGCHKKRPLSSYT